MRYVDGIQPSFSNREPAQRLEHFANEICVLLQNILEFFGTEIHAEATDHGAAFSLFFDSMFSPSYRYIDSSRIPAWQTYFDQNPGKADEFSDLLWRRASAGQTPDAKLLHRLDEAVQEIAYGTADILERHTRPKETLKRRGFREVPFEDLKDYTSKELRRMKTVAARQLEREARHPAPVQETSAFGPAKHAPSALRKTHTTEKRHIHMPSESEWLAFDPNGQTDTIQDTEKRHIHMASESEWLAFDPNGQTDTIQDTEPHRIGTRSGDGAHGQPAGSYALRSAKPLRGEPTPVSQFDRGRLLKANKARLSALKVGARSAFRVVIRDGGSVNALILDGAPDPFATMRHDAATVFEGTVVNIADGSYLKKFAGKKEASGVLSVDCPDQHAALVRQLFEEISSRDIVTPAEHLRGRDTASP
ncbi:hypothetical protein [Streptomyces sp. NPDC051014]|uniref:hypothetical protein n=1 Tax=Streptomyces sp. NPDC051014 TaxID=3155751 RepID=UPI0033F2B9BF